MPVFELQYISNAAFKSTQRQVLSTVHGLLPSVSTFVGGGEVGELSFQAVPSEGNGKQHSKVKAYLKERPKKPIYISMGVLLRHFKEESEK